MKKMIKKNEHVLTGDVSGLRGNVSGLIGDVDDCEITTKDRAIGVKITDLIQ